MKIIALIAALMLNIFCAKSQNLIGFTGKQILKYMKEHRREMHYNNVVNSKFSYLKYSDDTENETVLFFLNPDSVCRSVRIICDANMKNQKLKELNAKYSSYGESRWIDKHDGKKFIIEMKDGQWSCVISIEPE